MRYVKSHKMKHGFFQTMLISSLLSCLFAALFLACLYFPILLNSAKKNDEAYGQNLLEAVDNRFKELETAIQFFDSTVTYNSWMRPIYLDYINGRSSSPGLVTNMTNELVVVATRFSAFKCASFRFYGDDTLYSNVGIAREFSYFEKNYPDDPMYYFAFSTSDAETFSVVTLGKVEYLHYAAPFRDYPEGRYKGDINLLIQSDKLGKLLSNAADEDAASFRLVDQEGICIWKYDTGRYDEQTVTISKPWYKGKYQICVDIPKSVYNSSTNRAIPLLLFAWLSAVAVGIFAAYFLSRFVYAPLRERLQRITGGRVAHNNELSSLEKIFDDLKRDKTIFQEELKTLRPLAMHRLICSVLDGSVSMDVLDSPKYKLRFPYRLFYVVSIYAPFSKTICLDGASEEDAQVDFVMSVLTKSSASGMPLDAYWCSQDADYHSILVNASSEKEFDAFLGKMRDGCEDYFSNRLKDRCIFTGTGNPVERIDAVCASAEQARTALSVAIIEKSAENIAYKDIAQQMKYDYLYSLSDEVFLSRAITNGHEESAKSLIERVIESNRNADIKNPHAIWCLFMDLHSTIVRSGQSMGISLVSAPRQEELISYDDIVSALCSLIDRTCIQLSARHQEELAQNDLQILRYIDEHIYDADLSLSRIAQAFGKTSGYVSSIFKEKRGTNYNTYVNQKRIQRAIELLQKEGMDSNSVFPMVGYVSLSTFRRNFSKYAMCNPGEISQKVIMDLADDAE